MNGQLLMRFYVGVVALLSAASLVYVYMVPIESMRVTRDGVPHFTPPVIHPETMEPLEVGKVVRHYESE